MDIFSKGCLLLFILAINIYVTEAQSCPRPRSTSNLQYTCSRGIEKDSRCFFRCTVGYKLRSSADAIRICTCFGGRCRWSGRRSVCVAETSIRTVTPPTTTSTTTTSAPTSPAQSLQNNCPAPDFGRHSYKIVDSWPNGAIMRIIVKKNHLVVENGWSVLLTFTKKFPKKAKVMSWNSEMISMHDRYLSLSNKQHNANLTGVGVFTFTIVLLEADLQKMAGYTALVAFYPERVDNPSCFTLENNGNLVGVIQPTQTTGRSTPRPITRPTNPPRPATRPTSPPRPATRPTNPPRPATRPTNRPRPVTRPTNPPRPATRPTNRPRPVTRPTNPPRPVTRPTNPPRPVTRPNTNSPSQTSNPQLPNQSGDETLQINQAGVARQRGNCIVLRNNIEIRNPGYEVVGSSGNGPAFRFNANIMLNGAENRMNDWTLKVVFSKEISSIQVWEAKLGQKSPDGRVYLFQPHPWNANLRDDFSFLIIPEMRSASLPKMVMFLCPSGENPSLDASGIFLSPQTTQNQVENRGTSNRQTTSQEDLLREQEEIAREQREEEERRQEEERRRQAQLEREQRERQSQTSRPTVTNGNKNNNNNDRNSNNNRNQNRNNNSNNNSNRPVVTPRPISNAARCSGPNGRLPTNPGPTIPSFRRSPRSERRPYDYNEVISLSILFYEAQRSGKLPRNNRTPWRGDSGLRDGCDVGHDLTGGWYDAGDHVKFGLPMAWSVTTLAWGVIEFKQAYIEAGEYGNVLDSLKWVTDYFIKAHTSKYELYGQVGDGEADHGYWGRPEEMTMEKPSYKINQRRPGSDLAAETAAAMAACSVIFRETNPLYADLLVRHARELYEFADRYRGSYHLSIPAVADYYRSYSGFNDELVWGALWLYRATGANSYLVDAKNKYRQFGGGHLPKLFSWDDKRAGSQVLIANFTGEAKYRQHVEAYQRFLNGGGAPKTPKGLVWLDQWGSNRYAANAAFISLAATKIQSMSRSNKRSYRQFAESQIHYILGGSGRSFVVGYGNNPPTKPHHRSSSCPLPPGECSWGNSFHSNSDNPITLYGALVAGPAKDDSYVDDRGDYVANEVATDYNAGFQGALAGLKYYKIQARS